MDLILHNYNVNDADLPPELPPPNDWMIEIFATEAVTRKTILSMRIYVTIKRDGKYGAMG
jgi:hypothetical protein